MMRKMKPLLLLFLLAALVVGAVLFSLYFSSSDRLANKHSEPSVIHEEPQQASSANTDFDSATNPNGAGMNASELVDKETDSMARQGSYKIDLHNMAIVINDLNKPYESLIYAEIPKGEKISFIPQKNSKVLRGRMLQYQCDKDGNPITDGKQTQITDYGEFEVTVGLPKDDGSFTQSFTFLTPVEHYYPYAKTTSIKSADWSFNWEQDGTYEHIVKPGSPKWMLYADLRGLPGKELAKDQIIRSDPKATSTKILGYVTCGSHRCIALQQEVKGEFDISKNRPKFSGLPPIKTKVTTTIYIDVDYKLPIRVDSVTAKTFQPEHLNSPHVVDICGANPPYETKERATRRIFQLF